MKTKLHTLLFSLFFTIGHANAQWELQLNLNMYAGAGRIHFVNETHGWTTGGLIEGAYECLYTTNGGKNWYLLPGATSGIDVFFVSQDIGFLSTWDGIIRKTVNGGQTWRDIQTPTDKLIYNLQFVDEYNGWAQVYGGEILHTDDCGENWTVQVVSDSITPTHVSVHFLNSNTGWAKVSAQGDSKRSVWKTDNGGSEWDSIFSWPEGCYIDKIYFVNEQNGWALGRLSPSDSIFLSQTVDGGYTWNEKKLPFPDYKYEVREKLRDIQFINDTLGWIICNRTIYDDFDNIEGIESYVFVTKDGGSIWFLQFYNYSYDGYNPATDSYHYLSPFLDICMVSTKKGWIAAENYIYTTNNGDSIIGIPQKEHFNNKLNVYPNPFKDWISIQLPQYEKPTKVTISSIDGKILLHEDFPSDNTLNLNFLSKGVYFLTVYLNNNHSLTDKIIKL